jgi:signal transduction histidine kinase
VAHEINTPLGICITSASVINATIKDIHQRFEAKTLQKQFFESSYQELVDSTEILEKNLQRTSRLVASFKQVSVDQNVDTLRHFMLCDYLDKIVQSLRPKLAKSTHRIFFQPNDPDIEVFSNPGALSQVMTNLIENALLHAFHDIESGRVTISVTVIEQTITIKIKDNGSGMDENTQTHIFDPFFTTARHIGGTGLGMHIVYNLVTQQLQGKIECQTQLEKGTLFMITLPISQPLDKDNH